MSEGLTVDCHFFAWYAEGTSSPLAHHHLSGKFQTQEVSPASLVLKVLISIPDLFELFNTCS
jgi:hypothetical protein